MAYNNRRRNRNSDDGDGNNGNHSVPFQDANPELGEIPLDDIDTFVVPARDDKGAYTTIHLNIPPHMYRQLQIVVRSGRFPYLDVSDLARHALMRQLRFCVELRESLPNHTYTSTEALMEVCRDNELRLKIALAFEEIDRQISGHITRLEIPDAIRLLTILKNRIDKLPNSPRQHALRSGVLRRYGYVLEHSGAVRPMTEGEKSEHESSIVSDDSEVGQLQDSSVNETGERGDKHGGYQ